MAYRDYAIKDLVSLRKDLELPHFGHADFFVIVKPYEEDDPFRYLTSDNENIDSVLRPQNEEHAELAREYHETLRQMESYAAQLCAYQSRKHCFSLCFFGPYARLLRWDRAGFVASHRFKYGHENPNKRCPDGGYLQAFLRRYAQMGLSQRGYDTTILQAFPEEEKLFEEVVTKHVKEQRRLPDGETLRRYVLQHYEPGYVLKIAVHPQLPRREASKCKDEETPRVLVSDDASAKESASKAISATTLTDPDTTVEAFASHVTSAIDAYIQSLYDIDVNYSLPSKTPSSNEGTSDPGPSGGHPRSRCRQHVKTQYFLVSKPVSTPHKLWDRATQGWWAVKMPDPTLDEEEQPQMAFLKSQWRDMSSGWDLEGDTMVELVESGVPNVSDVFCHGYVQDEGRSDGGKVKRTNIPLFILLHSLI